MKKLIISLILLVSMGFAPKAVLADGKVLGETTEEEICVETTIYGGQVGYVCGIKTHEPVDTGIADNPLILGAGLLLASGLFYKFSKRLKAKQIA